MGGLEFEEGEDAVGKGGGGREEALLQTIAELEEESFAGRGGHFGGKTAKGGWAGGGKRGNRLDFRSLYERWREVCEGFDSLSGRCIFDWLGQLILLYHG